MANIKLKRAPSRRDHDLVSLAAQKPCECTKPMEENLKHGDEAICKPCAARQVLNGIVSLAETLNQ